MRREMMSNEKKREQFDSFLSCCREHNMRLVSFPKRNQIVD